LLIAHVVVVIFSMHTGIRNVMAFVIIYYLL